MLIGVAMVGEARKEKGGKGGRKQEEVDVVGGSKGNSPPHAFFLP